MGRSRESQGKNGGIYEPNMTPLIDVSLVLVVILLVATPMAFQSAIAVRTASATGKSAAQKTEADRIEVRVRADGRVEVDRVTVTPDSLAGALAPLLAASRERTVVVHCDPTVPHGTMVTVLDEAKAAGAAQIALADR